MPLYLFWGDEEFDIELKIKQLKETVLKNNVNPLNYKKTDNPTFNVLDEALRTQGMLFGDILHVINMEKYLLNSAEKNELSDFELSRFENSLENLNPGFHVVFVCKIPLGEKKKPDSRKKIYKIISKYAHIEQFEAFKAWDETKAVNWILKESKKLDIQITNKIALRIFSMTGVSKRALSNTLEKLKLVSYPDKVIQEKLLENVCFENDTISNLGDLILKKDYTRFLQAAFKITEKEHPLKIISFLHAVFSRLLLMKVYASNLSATEISKILNMHEFVIKQNLQKIKNTKAEELVQIKKNLTEIEYEMKTNSAVNFLTLFELKFMQSMEQIC